MSINQVDNKGYLSCSDRLIEIGSETTIKRLERTLLIICGNLFAIFLKIISIGQKNDVTVTKFKCCTLYVVK